MTWGAGAAVPEGASGAAAPLASRSSLPELTAEEWRQAATAAAGFVARETPASRLPFAAAAAGPGRRQVFAHYLPSLPISMDGAPPERDYYSRRLPTGREPESAAVKRFVVWERPIPSETWPARLSFATNAAVDVLRAERIGIDAFLVDLIGIEGRYWDWTRALTDAAAATETQFRIVPAPDMDALRNASLQSIADALAYFHGHRAGYRLPDGRLLIAPYRAERRPLAFWRDLQAEMARRGMPIAILANSLSIDGGPPYASVSVGLGFWGGRDPASAPQQAAAAARLTAKTGLPVMLPVAPQDFRPNVSAFWEARNSEAFRSQWEAAIRADVLWVQIATWNDYAEGTEIAPSSTTQFLFYDLAAYHIAWYKAGAPPPILRDALFYVSRRQIFDPGDDRRGAVYERLGGTPLANDIELIGLLSRPGTLEISLGGTVRRFAVAAGLQTVRLPARPGTPCFRLIRGGETMIALRAASAIAAAPRFQDGLYGGGSSLRPYLGFDAVPADRPDLRVPAGVPPGGRCPG